MSLLWSGRQDAKMKLSTNRTKPSPACQSNCRDSARNPAKRQKGSRVCPQVQCRFIEGISSLTSGTGLFSCELDGGMTVETAILLPLMLFFFLGLGCAIEMIRLHGNMQLALWQAGRELSVYGYLLDGGEVPDAGEDEDGWWKDFGERVFASTFVKNRLTKLAGKEYLESSPMTKGPAGLTLWESDLLGPGDTIDIIVTYSVTPWGGLPGLRSFRMANRYYSHLWNGYELGEETEKSEETQMVYITRDSSVYHLYAECTHLRISIRAVPAGEIGEERNQEGGRYRACEKCGNGQSRSVLYIAAWGDCYHCNRDCPALKRTVYLVERKEAEGRRLCGRCGERGA